LYVERGEGVMRVSSVLDRRTLIALASGLVPLRTTGAAFGQSGTAVPDEPVLPSLPDAASRPEGAVAVMATTPILADLARQVGGARVSVDSLVPPNASAHDFEPAPEHVVLLEDSALVIRNGLELDAWLEGLVESAGSRPLVTATDGIEPFQREGEEAVDPHVWLDPANAKVMAANIAAALAGIDEPGRSDYEARRTAYEAQIDSLDQWIASQIATIPPEHRKLVTSHDALGYFARRYGLTVVGAVFPSVDAQAEPSAQEIVELIERVRGEQAQAIFTEVGLDPRLEEEIAAQAGIALVPGLYVDTLGEAGSGAETYIGMMVANTLLIAGALRPTP
jgi:zinc/manganese transport system substrate-binding protein/manganese/iron transport system substrate-binding protein